MNRVFIVGACQESRTVANLLMEKNPLVDIEVLVERGRGEVGSSFHGLHVKGYAEVLAELPVTGSLVFADVDPTSRVASVGHMLAAREQQRAWPVKTVRATTAAIAASAKIGNGSIVFPGAVIMDGAEIGSYVMIGPGAIIGAEAKVSDFATLQAGSILGMKSYIGKGGICGLGAVVSSSRRVGAWSQVLDGFHVRKDLPPGKSS